MTKKIMALGFFAILITGLAACSGVGAFNSYESKENAPSPEERLAAMSNLLAEASAIRFETSETHDWQGLSGDQSRVEGKWIVTIWRPDALHIKAIASGTKSVDTELYYDGWTLVYENHLKKVWAWADVPSSIDAMLDEITWRYNLPIPIGDMLYSYPYDALMTDDTKSRFMGKEVIKGKQYDHFAFSQSSVDWDIWIATEGEPLPYRLDIIRKNSEIPSISKIIFTEIDLHIKPDNSLFSFKPKKDYTEISVVENKAPEKGSEESMDEGRTF